MVAESTAEALRRSSTRYLWMHNRDWIQMAEEGDPMIAVEGDGVRIIDSEGNSWIDVNGGYNSVNVGYGRQEIADAAYEQMDRLAYFPNGTTTEPTALLAKKLAEITPGTLSRVFPVSGGSEANETAIKIAGRITVEEATRAGTRSSAGWGRTTALRPAWSGWAALPRHSATTSNRRIRAWSMLRIPCPI